jgi:3-deoxy-D-manno-octulosonate 8-phosphate phosphatase (KDO 8-P phosphatase)
MIDLVASARNIELLLLDVDGVLTDGRVTYTETGDEIKRFHVRDGSGLKIWHSLGLKTAIISGRTSATVERRAKELGIGPVLQGQSDKLVALQSLFTRLNLTPNRVCAIGDDLPDLPILVRCGLSVAVADACPEVRAVANYTTSVPGGAGAVREAIEWILKLRNQWDDVVKGYRAETEFAY